MKKRSKSVFLFKGGGSLVPVVFFLVRHVARIVCYIDSGKVNVMFKGQHPPKNDLKLSKPSQFVFKDVIESCFRKD